jgi:type II secretion system protein N
VNIDSFDLSPLWLSLLSANQGVRWDGRLLNGQVLADIYRDGTFNVDADNLMLDFPLQEGSSLHLSGHLNQGQMQSTLPLGKTTASNLQLVLDKVQLVGLDGLHKELTLGTIALQATGRGHSFKITSLEASGGDFALSGRGNFLLGRNLLSSRLNFRIEIRPTQNADPTLVSLLELAARKKADGSHELHLGGTLSKPTLK